MNREEIRAAYLALKKRPLGEITLEEIKVIKGESEWRIVLNAMPNSSYEFNFITALETMFKLVGEKTYPDRASYVVGCLLENSAAVIMGAPCLMLGGLRFETLPYSRATIPYNPYNYQNLNFVGAKLHERAAITAIRGGANIKEMDSCLVSKENLEKLKQLQDIVTEAKELLTADGKGPRGIKEIFDRIIDDSKTISQILDELRTHFAARRGSCLVRFCCCLYGREAAVHAFYWRWATTLQRLASTEESTHFNPAHGNGSRGKY